MRADRQRVAQLGCYVNFPHNSLKVFMFPMGRLMHDAQRFELDVASLTDRKFHVLVDVRNGK